MQNLIHHNHKTQLATTTYYLYYNLEYREEDEDRDQDERGNWMICVMFAH
jgi:hypothetical protein